MADCKACGAWFSSTAKTEICPTCERALKRLNGYAVPVVHGRWIPVDGEGEPCDEWDRSICERRLTFGEEMETDEVYELNHYCPNCGAKMDGERREGE